MIVRFDFKGWTHKMGEFAEKKFLHFMGAYGILKSVVEQNGVNI